MKFIRKPKREATLGDIAPGDCFKFPGSSSNSVYMRIGPTLSFTSPNIVQYVSLESGEWRENGLSLIVVPIDVELREV